MFAVQPAAWSNLDEYGCEYTPTIQGAYTIAQQMTEPATIWRMTSGAPIKWMNVTPEQVSAA